MTALAAKVAAFVAGLILVAFVCWVVSEMVKANGGHHPPDTSAGGSDPAPRERPRPE